MAILCGSTEDQNLWQKLNCVWGGHSLNRIQWGCQPPASVLQRVLARQQGTAWGAGRALPTEPRLSEYRTQVTMGARILASVCSAELADEIILETSAVFLTATMARTCKLEGLAQPSNGLGKPQLPGQTPPAPLLVQPRS